MVYKFKYSISKRRIKMTDKEILKALLEGKKINI